MLRGSPRSDEDWEELSRLGKKRWDEMLDMLGSVDKQQQGGGGGLGSAGQRWKVGGSVFSV